MASRSARPRATRAPAPALAQLEQGPAFRQAGQFDKARAAWTEQACSSTPSSPPAVLNLGILLDLYPLGDSARALDPVRAPLALTPRGDASVSKWIADLRTAKPVPVAAAAAPRRSHEVPCAHRACRLATNAIAQDRAEIDPPRSSVNREPPKVLYIVPWEPVGQLGQARDVLDEVLAPVDREVFRRQVAYQAQHTRPRPRPPRHPSPTPPSPTTEPAPQRSPMSVVDFAVKFFQDSGVAIYFSIAIMAVGLAIAIERFVFLRRARSDNRKLWATMLPVLEGGRFKEVHTWPPVHAAIGKIVVNGLERMQSPGRRGKTSDAAMEEGMMEIVPRLEKRTHYIATLANVITPGRSARHPSASSRASRPWLPSTWPRRPSCSRPPSPSP